MKNVKQVIVVRRDLRLKRSDLVSLTSSASLRFVLENNEAVEPDKIIMKLSTHEVQWIKEGMPIDTFFVDSQDALNDIAFRCELEGISVCSVKSQNANKDEQIELLCVALGPDEDEQLYKITKNLKAF